MHSVAVRIARVRETIAEAALRSGRDPSDVRLMAVTKQVHAERIVEAVEAGIDCIGENYIQEAQGKYAVPGLQGVEWHCIGHLQRNKAKYAVRFMDMIHSVDRLDLAREIDRRAGREGRIMRVLVEVNVAGEASKSGVSLKEASDLVRRAAGLEHISIQGLMTMPPWSDDPEDARPFFRILRDLRERLREERVPRVSMDELSMGMSTDYAVAVEEGATIVRIGTAIFGIRT